MAEDSGIKKTRYNNLPYGEDSVAREEKWNDVDVSEQEFLRRMRKRFTETSTVWDPVFTEGKEDLEFLMGNQWDSEVKNQRKLEGRPCLTVNYLTRLCDIAIGDFRQNRISITVSPSEYGGKNEIAKIMESLIRRIQNKSDAEAVYDTASEQALNSSFGAFRINTKYEDGTFDQDIVIERIVNPFCVMFDPNARKKDFSDARFCFVIDHIPKDEFEKRWPDKRFMNFEGTSSDPYIGWFDKEKARICEYWVVEEEEIDIVELVSGDVTDYNSDIPDEMIATDEDGEQKRRKSVKKTVTQYIVSGSEILEGPNEWAGKYIPIVPVLGREKWVANTRKLTSLIRFAKDAQRMLNYWRTSATENVALAPKTQIIVTEDQIEGHEAEWRNMNVKPTPFLIVKGGTGDPMPQRLTPPPIPDGLLQEANNCVGDIQTITNMHEAVTGQPSNERSGKAISARQRQSNISTFTFFDNLQSAIKYAGTILVDLIPKIYTTPRIMKSLQEDGTIKELQINQPMKDPMTGIETIMNDLSEGKYEVETKAGPSFVTARIEAAQNMLDFMRNDPQHAPLIADLFVKNLDFPGADEISTRIRKTLPPGIAEPLPGEKPPPPNPQQQMAQQKQQMDAQQMQMDFQTKQKEMQLKEKEMMLELNHQKVELERIKTEMHKTMVDREKSGRSSSDHIRQVVLDILKELHQPADFR